MVPSHAVGGLSLILNPSYCHSRMRPCMGLYCNVACRLSCQVCCGKIYIEFEGRMCTHETKSINKYVNHRESTESVGGCGGGGRG